MIRHTCDVKLCIEPTHLLLGTAKQNTADMMQRDRGLLGMKNGHAKLTDNQVCQLREEYATGVQQKVLAAKYGVNKSVVGEIARGIARPGAPGPISPKRPGNQQRTIR